jgi:hypothetical protein
MNEVLITTNKVVLCILIPLTLFITIMYRCNKMNRITYVCTMIGIVGGYVIGMGIPFVLYLL